MYRNIFMFVLVGVLFFSCTKKNDNQPTKNDSANSAKNEKEIILDKGIFLVYDLQKGMKYKYSINSIKKTNESVSVDTSMSQSLTETSEYVVSFTVTERDEEGNMTLDFLCEQVKAKGENSMGQKLEYDSKKPPTDTSQKAMFINYEIVTSSNFSLRISRTGEVLDIFRFDKIMNKFISQLPKQPTLTEKEQLKTNLREGLLRPMVIQVFKTLTNKELKKDSSWVNTYPGELAVFQIENIATYKLNKIFTDGNSQFAEVKSSLEVKFKGKNQYTEQGVTYTFQTPKTYGTGFMIYDMNKKLVSKAESNIYLEMTMTAKENKAGGKSGKRITKVETKNSFQLIN